MSRTSRIPYHQNVYDLLQLEPTECPEAARMIADHEAKHGPLPASVREWYLVPKVVPLIVPPGQSISSLPEYARVYPFRDPHTEIDLFWVLHDLEATAGTPRGQCARVATFNWDIPDEDGNPSISNWYFEVCGLDDPPISHNNEGEEVIARVALSSTFCDMMTTHLCEHYLERFMICSSRDSWSPWMPGVKPFEHDYANGLWLRSPAEPFEPAVIDFLIDQFGEPERTPRPGNVTTYTFRPDGSIIRITADEPKLGGGLSAWWVHADTPEKLAELARLIVPFGTLRETLRADTDPARNVLQSLPQAPRK